MHIIFMGSAAFGLPALEGLREEGHSIAAVVSTPPRRRGRGMKFQPSPVSAYARENGLGPVLEPDTLRDVQFVDTLRGIQAELYVVVAFRILPPEIFTIPPLGAVNIHASLLPRYRGPAPVQRAIEAGERETGVTVFRIDKGIDTGGVLLQRSTIIGETETTPELLRRLSHLGAEALKDAVRQLESGNISPRPQNGPAASRAPKLRKEEGILNWEESATALFNKIRAYQPFPQTWTWLQGSRLTIERAVPADTDCEGPPEPGTVCDAGKKNFCIQCGRGRLCILQVRPVGKRSMSAADYINGFGLRNGQRCTSSGE